MEQRVDRLEANLGRNSVINDRVQAASGHAEPQGHPDHSQKHVLGSASSDEGSSPSLNLTCSLGAFPAASMDGVLQDDSPSAPRPIAINEQVSTNSNTKTNALLSRETAAEHFSFFREYLDAYVHFILKESDTLTSMRNRSPFLATALCATAAYSTGSSDWREWVDQFQAMVAEKTFSRQHNFDDVRALCVGALWLDELATAFSALGKNGMSSPHDQG